MVQIKRESRYGAEFQKAGETSSFRPAIAADFCFVRAVLMILSKVLLSLSSVNLSLLILHKTGCGFLVLHCSSGTTKSVLCVTKKKTVIS
jgi:hypothetical protein